MTNYIGHTYECLPKAHYAYERARDQKGQQNDKGKNHWSDEAQKKRQWVWGNL